MKNGYVTVFFSLSVTLLLSLVVGLLYGVRENALRMRAREVTDIAMVSAFAEFNRELWNQYGLLFVDAGYGAEASSLVLPEEHVLRCMNRNFGEGGLFTIGGSDILKLVCADVETKTIRFATDDCGQAVFEQAVFFMKNKYKLSYIEGLYKLATEYEKYEFTGNELKSEQEKALNQLEGTEEASLVGLENSAREAVVDSSGVSWFSSLRLILGDISQVSTRKMNEDICVSGRDLNEGNATLTEKEDVGDGLFFREYLVEKTGNYLEEKTGSALVYELEYLIAGKSADSGNLEAVVNRILLIREAANLISIYDDDIKQGIIKVASEVVSLVIGAPEASEAIRALINCVWAYAESVNDVKKLMRGKKVPFIKTSGNWESGLDFLKELWSPKEENEGVGYKDYLRLFVFLSDKDQLLERFLNICELNVIKATQNEEFRLDYCFDYWEVSAYVISEYGYSYVVNGNYKMEDR